MRIGIDIDGVLTDIEQWQLDYGSKIIFEQYTTVELAKEYGVSTDVIRQRIHRARLKLQDKINNKKS